MLWLGLDIRSRIWDEDPAEFVQFPVADTAVLTLHWPMAASPGGKTRKDLVDGRAVIIKTFPIFLLKSALWKEAINNTICGNKTRAKPPPFREWTKFASFNKQQEKSGAYPKKGRVPSLLLCWGSPFTAPSHIVGHLMDPGLPSWGMKLLPGQPVVFWPLQHSQDLALLCSDSAKLWLGQRTCCWCDCGSTVWGRDKIPGENWRILIMAIFISTRCQPSELIECNWKTQFSNFLYYYVLMYFCQLQNTHYM